MDLSLIILSFNTKDITRQCLESVIKKTQGLDYEIIVIDNASKDGSVALLKKLQAKYPQIKLIVSRKNLGFAGGNNVGLKKARGKYLLFLNSDTVLEDNLLPEMVAWLEKNPQVGGASCALKNKDRTLQATGGYFPTLLRVFSWMTIQDLPGVDFLIKPFHPMKEKSFLKNVHFYQSQRELDWVTGAFMLFKREVFDQVKNWDEKYFMYVEEVDLCYRIKKSGWKIVYLPQWSIIHLGGASGTRELSVLGEFQGLKRFYQKFYPKWQLPLLRLILKIGCLGRIVLFGILEGKESARIYAQAFREV